LHERGYKVVNIDSTVICELPKLSPHTAQMRALIAEDCQVGLDAINVKATTTEKLGFTGRGEGIAAEAVCLIAQA
jgi:2-C-methyl-D-erythritol 2,4-cyclodiphosphate synthase